MRGFCLLAIAFTLAGQTPDGLIGGHVFNSVTGAPIRKATVRLIPEIASQGLVAETDSDGRFEFTGLPPGHYSLSGSHAGFADRFYGARPNKMVAPPMVLGRDEHITDADLRLPPFGVVSGRVLDEDGDPVDSANVMVLRQAYHGGRKQWTQSGGANSNEKGEYRVAKLAPGRYLVLARRQSSSQINTRFGSNPDLPEKPEMVYVPTYFPNATTEEAASPVEVAAGGDLQGIDVHLSKAPSFHVRGMLLGAQSVDTNEMFLGLDRGGGNARFPGFHDYHFDIANVVAGQYTLYAGWGNGANRILATQPLTVAANVTGVVVNIPPPIEVPGQVTIAEAGTPIKLQDVSVFLGSVFQFGANSSIEADSSGRFSFKPVSPGRFRTLVNGYPDAFYVQKVKIGGQEVSPDDFEISSAAPMEIVLGANAGRISGSVTDKDGKPVVTATVILVSSEKDAKPLSPTSANLESFSFGSLKPGTYQLFAWEDVEDGIWQDADFRKKYEGRATEIKVGPGETQKVTVKAVMAEEMK